MNLCLVLSILLTHAWFSTDGLAYGVCVRIVSTCRLRTGDLGWLLLSTLHP